MITGSHNALPVRQTAASSPKACWRLVGRISVGLALGVTLWCAVSACVAADPKKDSGPRIVPATKSPSGGAAPSYEEAKPRRRNAKPDSEVPPLPAEAMPGVGRPPMQMRIIPGESLGSADFQRFERIYRSIPYRRLAYQANPRYREELAMA